jgi:flagellar operon protein
MNKIGNQFSSIEQVTGQYLKQIGEIPVKPTDGKTFLDILSQAHESDDANELRFSKHASMRLESRNINLSPEQKNRLETGALKAQAKGIKESLVLIDSLAFIVNVPNKTVVTAMEQNETEEQIYTNIDGAVIN